MKPFIIGNFNSLSIEPQLVRIVRNMGGGGVTPTDIQGAKAILKTVVARLNCFLASSCHDVVRMGVQQEQASRKSRSIWEQVTFEVEFLERGPLGGLRWLVDWLFGWLADWLVGWLIGWLGEGDFEL